MRGDDRGNTSGGTTALSSVTNEAPMVLRVPVSQLGSPAAVGPIEGDPPGEDAEAEAEQDLDAEGRQAQPALGFGRCRRRGGGHGVTFR